MSGKTVVLFQLLAALGIMFCLQACTPVEGSASRAAPDGGTAGAEHSEDDSRLGIGGAGQPQDGVVSFHAVSLAQMVQQELPVTLGQVFAKGDVPRGMTVVATLNGRRLPTQIDKKATWDDGSLRHAVITVRLNSLAAGADPRITFEVVESTPQGPDITLAQLLGTGFDAEVTVELDGTTYRASARDMLRQIAQSSGCPDWSRQCKHWLSGPLVSEWIVGGPLSRGSEETQHLSVYFHVRAYADVDGTITRVRVDNVLENTHAYVPKPHNLTYDVHMQAGHDTFSVDNLTHYRQARWHKVLWWGDKPRVFANVDTEYLQRTRAISNYADVTPTDKFLNKVAADFQPMDNGSQTNDMGQTGAQGAIGPLPRWTTVYVVSGGDKRAFDWMLANDDAVGSYGFHYRDEATGRPLKITDHPYITIADIDSARRTDQEDLLPQCDSSCRSPYAFDIAHHPSIGYVPYLVTGDFYYLEEMQFTASYIELWPNAKYRSYDKGRLRHAQPQVRGQAWALRSLTDAAFATPDEDPMKVYFQTMVANTLTDYYHVYVESGGNSPLHIADVSGGVKHDLHGQKNVAISPWQQHFFEWAIGHAAAQGFDKAEPLSKWLSHFVINQMTDWLGDPDGGYCWLVASAYRLQIRNTRKSPFYGSLDEVYQKNYPELVGLDCNSPQYVNILTNGEGKQGQMVGHSDSATGFPSNLQIGLAMAVDSGVPGGRRAWDIFQNRSVQPYPDKGGRVNYRNYPNFAVIPYNSSLTP